MELTPEGTRVTFQQSAAERSVVVDKVLVGIGRAPNVEWLGLEHAGVDFGPAGIMVDARLRTTNKKIYAIGDCIGGFQFTHQAGYHAGIILRNLLFRVPARSTTARSPG